MDRRDAIKRAALLSGFAISAPLMGAFLTGCEADTSTAAATPYKPAYLSAQEMDLVRTMADRALPTTDTPGATDVGVAEYIDRMLAQAIEPKESERFRRGLNEFASGYQTEFGKSFIEEGPEMHLSYMNRVNESARRIQNPPPEEQPFFAFFMQMVLMGYFTSEQVGTQVLAYDPVPGDYQGCIPLADVGASWAL